MRKGGPMQKQQESSKPRIGVGVVVVKQGKLLLGKRKNAHGSSTWAPSGGHLEFGETIEQCAIRELAEETGLKPASMKLGPWTENMIQGKHYITIFTFVHLFEGEAKLLEPDKCEGWQWFDCDHLPEPLFPSVESLIKKMGLKDFKEAISSKEYIFN